MEVKFKRLNKLAKMPTQATSGSAGWDLYAGTEYDIAIAPHQTAKIDLGFATEFEPGVFAAIYPRSGISIKRGLALANKVAVIDADYRGSWIIALHNHSDELQTIDAGERIAQVVFQKYETPSFVEVKELSDTERGEGGLGSSGRA